MSKKDETISKLRKDYRELKKRVKAHCTDCNYDLKHDCRIKKCALYPYFRELLLYFHINHFF